MIHGKDREIIMKELQELIEYADNTLKNGEDLPSEIKNSILNCTKNNGFAGIAQINTKIGDLEYNAKKIAKYIKFAENIGLESVIFPELALTGFPLEDILQRYKVVVEDNVKWIEGLAKLTHNTIALVGFIEPYEGKYYNSIGILHKGKIQGIVRKSICPQNPASNDYKYQEFSKNRGTVYNGYAITIGEDIFADNNSDYRPLDELSKENPKLYINCSAFYSKTNRELLKNNTIAELSKKYNTPFIYVNQIGANDNILFEGLSSLYSDGNLISRAKYAEEQFLLVNPYKNEGVIYPLPQGFEKEIADKPEFSLDYKNELERTYKALILGIKDYFGKCGFKRAVLGLSGGLDSTICAVLLADAIGKENVIGISMPSHITSKESKSDAEQLANNLGINFFEAPIRSIIDTTSETFSNLFNQAQTKWTDRYKKSFTPDNIQARSRAMILWGVSNEFPSCIPIATSDKSEAYMGYATINGDMSGGFAPIADITKTKLFALARWLNKNRKEKNVIPESIILKRPGAELAINPKTGKALIAEDALMPYDFLDEIIWRIENLNQEYNELLNTEFVYEKNNNISREQKIEWLDKFYNRMSKAFYKWSISAPSLMIEEHSINSRDYNQLITSCGINYKGTTNEHIIKSLS